MWPEGSLRMPASLPVLPHEVPIAELATCVGPELANTDVSSPRRPDGTEPIWLVEVPPSPPRLSNQLGKWLGVIILTPHFRPVRAAVRCLPQHGLQHVQDVIHDDAPGGGIRRGQLCIPVRPQPFQGFGTFIRFPSLVRRHPAGNKAAVVMDLRSIGGYMFACLLPSNMDGDELFTFAAQQVGPSEEPLVLVVGCQDRPHDQRLPVRLHDGDLLVFSRVHRAPPNNASAYQLFTTDAEWEDPDRLPYLGSCQGLLVQHQEDRMFLPPHHHVGRTSLEMIAEQWDCPPQATISGVFPTPNLDYRGCSCSHVLRIVDLPPLPRLTPANVRRRDLFVLCDLRALGYAPRALHTHVPILHLPSLASLCEVQIPANMRLATWEGTLQGDEVTFEGHSVLTFYAEEEAPPPAPRALYIELPDAGDEPFDWSLRNHPGVMRSSPNRANSNREQVHPYWSSSGSHRHDVRVHEHTIHCKLAPAETSLPELVKWLLGFKDHARLPGNLAITPVCLQAKQCMVELAPEALTAAVFCVPDPSLIPSMTCKLLQEPVSHSAEARANIEFLRDFEEDAGRLWPYLPADDPFALQGVLNRAADDQELEEGEAHEFAMGLLTPGYAVELVLLTLTAPVELADALMAAQESRDQVHARLFPWLIPVEPQPAQGYGLLLALPAWAVHDTIICVDSTCIDERLFATGAPTVATREGLLDLASLAPHDHFEVYVGESHVPMQAREEADMRLGLCIFFTPRHVLPGPFFWLPESLLASAVWDEDPAIPAGPDTEQICVVWDMGHKCTSSSSSIARWRLPRWASHLLRPWSNLSPHLSEMCQWMAITAGMFVVSWILPLKTHRTPTPLRLLSLTVVRSYKGGGSSLHMKAECPKLSLMMSFPPLLQLDGRFIWKVCDYRASPTFSILGERSLRPSFRCEMTTQLAKNS